MWEPESTTGGLCEAKIRITHFRISVSLACFGEDIFVVPWMQDVLSHTLPGLAAWLSAHMPGGAQRTQQAEQTEHARHAEQAAAPRDVWNGFAGKELLFGAPVGAELAGAELASADLACTDLAGADLAGAELACAELAGADLGCGGNLEEFLHWCEAKEASGAIVFQQK